MSIRELIQRIVNCAEKESMDELVEKRRVCVVSDEKHVSLAEFIRVLHVRAMRATRLSAEVLDMAYDLTVDKFTRLPVKSASLSISRSDSGASQADQGPTCIPYYQAILRRCENFHDEKSAQLIDDATVAWQIQRFVVRHFHFSVKEAKRTVNGRTHRYVWLTSGGRFSLYMPRYMTGDQKRNWLETYVKDVDAKRPLERERIQQFVDSFVPKDPVGPIQPGDYGIGNFSFNLNYACVSDENRESTLVTVLADEKANQIETLRPSVRKLGAQLLKQLIRDIFTELEAGTYSEQALAAKYGLSTPTFSRFAGSRWSKKEKRGSEVNIPDLWRNLARLLAGSEELCAAAGRAGVWKAVQDISASVDATVPANGENGRPHA
jgi:hypothetical protein